MNTAVSYDLSLSDAWAAGLASLEIISANEALRLHHALQRIGRDWPADSSPRYDELADLFTHLDAQLVSLMREDEDEQLALDFLATRSATARYLSVGRALLRAHAQHIVRALNDVKHSLLTQAGKALSLRIIIPVNLSPTLAAQALVGWAYQFADMAEQLVAWRAHADRCPVTVGEGAGMLFEQDPRPLARALDFSAVSSCAARELSSAAASPEEERFFVLTGQVKALCREFEQQVQLWENVGFVKRAGNSEQVRSAQTSPAQGGSAHAESTQSLADSQPQPELPALPHDDSHALVMKLTALAHMVEQLEWDEPVCEKACSWKLAAPDVVAWLVVHQHVRPALAEQVVLKFLEDRDTSSAQGESAEVTASRASEAPRTSDAHSTSASPSTSDAPSAEECEQMLLAAGVTPAAMTGKLPVSALKNLWSAAGSVEAHKSLGGSAAKRVDEQIKELATRR